MNDPAGDHPEATPEPSGSESEIADAAVPPPPPPVDIYWRVVAIIMLVIAPLVLAVMLTFCSQHRNPMEQVFDTAVSRSALTIVLMAWGTWIATAVIMLQKRVSLKGLILAALAVGALGALPQMFK